MLGTAACSSEIDLRFMPAAAAAAAAASGGRNQEGDWPDPTTCIRLRIQEAFRRRPFAVRQLAWPRWPALKA